MIVEVVNRVLSKMQDSSDQFHVAEAGLTDFENRSFTPVFFGAILKSLKDHHLAADCHC